MTHAFDADRVVTAARLADLVVLGERLARASSTADVLDVVAADVAGVLGFDHADIALVRDEELVSGQRHWPSDPEIASRYAAVPLDLHLPANESVHTRAPVLVDDLRRYQADHPALLADVEALRVVSAAAVPFLDAKGDVLGVLSLVAGRRVELHPATESLIRIVGELCGNAMRRIQVAERAVAMAALAARLAGSLTALDVAVAIRDHGHQPLGATYVDIRLVDRDKRTLEPLLVAASRADSASGHGAVALDAPLPVSAAALLDEPIWIPDLDDCRHRFPAAAEDADVAGFAAVAAVPLHDSAALVTGVLVMAWRRPVDFNPLVQGAIVTVADLAAQSLERARLTDAQGTRARRNAAVARLGQLVAAASTVPEAAALLVEHGAPAVGASGAGVALYRVPSGELRFVHDPGHDGLATHPYVDAFRTGVAVVLESREAHRDRYPEVLQEIEAAGVQATVVLPLVGHAGEPFGAVGFAWSSRRRFDADDLAVLRTISELGARTLERAEVNDQRTHEARSLAELAASLATAVSRPQVAKAVGEHVPAMLHTTYASMLIANDARTQLDNLSAEALPADLAERYRTFPLTAPLPAVDAFRSGTTTTSSSREETLQRYPGLAEDLDRTGVESAAQLVVRDAADRPIGVLSVGWAATTVFDSALLARLDTIGELIGQTLERADLYDSEHQLVATLQRRFLGDVPVPPGTELVTRYLPAARSVGIGGDWFEVVLRPDGFTLVVGDVTGHGVEAVTAMAQLRTLLGGLVRAGESIETVFDRADAMLDRTEHVLASAELFDVDTAGWALRYCSAGHPWALLRRTDGTVVLLDGGQRPLIGIPTRSGPIPCLHLAAGDVVVAYTDGLVERRGEPITSGIDRLAACLAEQDPGVPLEDLADALLSASGIEAGGQAELEDDVALVLLRRG